MQVSTVSNVAKLNVPCQYHAFGMDSSLIVAELLEITDCFLRKGLSVYSCFFTISTNDWTRAHRLNYKCNDAHRMC